MAAPSFDRPLIRRSAPEVDKRIDAISLKIGANVGKGDDRENSSDAASLKTDDKAISAFSQASPWNASSKSSDEISSSTSAADSKTSVKLSHSVSFSLKTNFHRKLFENVDADNFAEELDKSSRLSNQEDPLIEIPPPPPSLSSTGNIGSGRDTGRENLGSGSASVVARSPSVTVANFLHCKLCLCDYPPREMVQLSNCRCLFCADCVSTYITTTINDGEVLKITCPDGECPADFKEIDSNQIRQIIDDDVAYANYVRFRTLREIENDPNGTWCPSVGCETICHVCRVDDAGANANGKGKASPPQPITCPTCSLVFCSVCKSKWHPEGECHNPFFVPSSSSTNFGGKTRSQRSGSLMTSKNSNNNLRHGSNSGNFFQNFLRRGPAAMEAPGADGALDSSPIKRCPICHILIEREEGCAQMMCKRCKHVFCWYCLESLDNDFLLRHYDRGPCKNKLGHSRASVIWHRTQVVGIFAGFGMLLLMASPFLLLAAPCILCCKCSCCHCLDIDDVEWYEGKGSPGTREARQKRLAKSFGGASTSGLDDDETDYFEDVPSFHSWDRKQEDKAAKSREKIKTEMLTMTTTTTTTTSPMETSNGGVETLAEADVKPLDG